MAAAGPFIVPYLSKLNLVSATDILAANTSNFRLALVTSSYVPNLSTDELWGSVSAYEIAGGTGYTTGGAPLTGVVLSQTGGVVTFTSAAYVWTASGGGISAWRRGVIYYLGTLNSKLNPLMAHFLGDSTPQDVPTTTAGNTLTYTPSGSGIITLT